tara:strand:+ start:805 stop:2349 length:1545 start_codon:yes stop_codon:yes gene_type:complete
MTKDSVDIRPTVGYLSILPSISYKPWYAIAEFVDNSLQSYLDNKNKLKKLHPSSWKLRIGIYISNSKITIIDNAAGIGEKDYYRAFRAAARPEKRDGLSEFGMGMKTAACWFSPVWEVKSKAIGEKIEKKVKFDINKIVKDNVEELEVKESPAGINQHGTEINLHQLRRGLGGVTKGKIKEHLSSMYRLYIKKNEIEIRVNDEKLEYKIPPILNAPFFYEQGLVKNEKKIKWIKDIDFKYGKSKKIIGFAAIFDEGKIGFSKSKYAGFNLFRRNRLIKGVGENEGFRPPSIFGDNKSFRNYRIFGELHLDDQEVSHTKDEFLWDDEDFNEFLDKLKKCLQKEPVNIYQQADNYRLERRARNLKIQTSEGLDGAIKLVPGALKILQDNKVPILLESPKVKLTPKDKQVRSKLLNYEGNSWNFKIILNYDKNERDWIQIYEKGNKTKDIEITVAMGMGFTRQYFGSTPEEVEGMLALIEYIALAEIVEKDRGTSKAHAIRISLNEIIRKLPPALNN